MTFIEPQMSETERVAWLDERIIVAEDLGHSGDQVVLRFHATASDLPRIPINPRLVQSRPGMDIYTATLAQAKRWREHIVLGRGLFDGPLALPVDSPE